MLVPGGGVVGRGLRGFWHGGGCRRVTIRHHPHTFTRGHVHSHQPTPVTPPVAKSNAVTRWSLLVILVGRSRQVQVLEHMREVTWCMLRVMSRQCKVHTSQRLRRAMQLYSVYSRMWGEEAARSMLGSLRRTLVSRGRSVLLSALCLNCVDWEKEKIPDERLQRGSNDLDSVGALCRATIQCDNCGRRQVIDQQMSNVEYCVCGGSVGYTSDDKEYESWRPFIEREHHIVWRRRHPVHPHLYAYKVYGSYDDVSLSAFMEVQLNCHYRTEWDDTALQLRVLGSHPESNSELVYWLVKFPAFFSNRDYIFKRRFAVNEAKREVVIMSEAVSPDLVAEEKGVHRVNEYWSTMVIRARHDNISKPGLEYTLTYFDNPGTSLPQSITNFIAVTGFPNFLKKLHQAALSLQSVYEQGQDVYVSLPPDLRHPRLKRRDAVLEELEEPADYRSGEVAISSLCNEEFEAKTGSLDDGKSSRSGGVKLSEAISDIKLETETESEDKSFHDSDVTSAVSKEITQDISENRFSGKHKKAVLKLPDGIMVGQEEEKGKISEDQLVHDSEASCDFSKHKASSSVDMAVNVGSKKVAVDLLEAMEVVAPELEGRALLLIKIEKLTGIKLDDPEKQSVIVEKLEKLKNKLKSFQERAALKKERSMKKMEELANRDHYDHLFADEKTLVQLELLFQAMKDVLQADRDMRTGKGLMDPVDKASTGVHGNTGSSKYSTISQSDSSIGFESNKAKVDSNLPEEENLRNSLRKRKGDTEKKSNPPEDPPPPSSNTDPSNLQSPSVGKKSSSDAGTGDGQSTDRSDILGESDSSADQSSSWLHFPYISAWWDSDNKKHESNQSSSSFNNLNGTVTDEKRDTELKEEVSRSFAAQIWHIVSLGWVFTSENKSDGTCIQEKLDLEDKDEHSVNKVDHGEVSSKWYWYPISGVYRAYAWMFSASGESA